MNKLFLVLVCFLFTTLPGFAQAGEKILDIQSVTSDAGIKAWLVEDHSVPVIAMQFSFRDAGAKNDPEGKQGLAQLASNTMDEGAGELNSQAFQKALEDHSITLRFNSSRDHFGGNVKTLTRNKDKAFDLLALALTSPRFDPEPVHRMRESNKSRIRSSLTNPRWMAARIQNDKIFAGHPYALNSGGTISSLDAITPEDLRGFHKKLIQHAGHIGVAGDITAEELKLILDKVFGNLPYLVGAKSTKQPLQNAGKTFIYKQDIPQTVISMTQPGISRKDEDYHKAKVMNFILGESGFGSRLMEEIREKRGLSYGAFSYFREYEEADTLHVSTSTANETVSKTLGIIHDEWERIKTAPVSAEELKDAKSYLIGSLPLSFTTTDAIASTLVSLQLDDLPIDYLETRKDKLANITAADVQAAAQRILNKDAFTTILVGDPQNIGNAETVAELPNVE